MGLTAHGVGDIALDGHDLLGDGGMTLEVRRDTTDAWSVGAERYDEPVVAAFEASGEWQVEESGPLRARVWCEGWIAHSRARWTLSVERASPCLDMTVEIVFNEPGRLLQLSISLVAAPAGWMIGLPGGLLSRLPDGREWPLQAWTCLDLPEASLAVVTDDCYSTSLEDRTWRGTLLRSPEMARLYGPWDSEGRAPTARRRHTDQGAHVFSFTLYGSSTALESSVLQRAVEHMAHPPIVFDRYEGLDRPPWGNVAPDFLR